MRTTTEVFEDHLAKRLVGQTEEDIKTNYDTSVILLTGTGAFIGHDGVRASAAQLKELTSGATFEYRHTLVKDNYAFLEWTAHAKDKAVYDGADSFVIESGKIVMQSIHYSVTKK